MKIIKVQQDETLARLIGEWYETFVQKDMDVQADIFGTMYMVFSTGSSTTASALQVLRSNIEIRKNTCLEYSNIKDESMPDPSPAAAAYMQQVIYEANIMLTQLKKQGL